MYLYANMAKTRIKLQTCAGVALPTNKGRRLQLMDSTTLTEK